MSQRLLNPGPVEGEYIDERDQMLERLQDENRELKRQLLEAQAEAAQVRRAAARSTAPLRKILEPWQRAIAIVLREADEIDGGELAASGGNSKWDAVKQRLQPRLREAVDIFLAQGSLKRTQLAAAMRMDYSNCNKNVITILLRQGLLVEDGRGLSLKEL